MVTLVSPFWMGHDAKHCIVNLRPGNLWRLKYWSLHWVINTMEALRLWVWNMNIMSYESDMSFFDLSIRSLHTFMHPLCIYCSLRYQALKLRSTIDHYGDMARLIKSCFHDPWQWLYLCCCTTCFLVNHLYSYYMLTNWCGMIPQIA